MAVSSPSIQSNYLRFGDISDPFVVNTTIAGDQIHPDVAALSDGRFFVVWEDRSGLDGESGGVFGQLFESDGAKIGGELLIPTVTAGWQTGPEVVASSDDSLYVAWKSGGNSVHGRILNSDGSAMGDWFTVSGFFSYGVEAAVDSSDSFVVSVEHNTKNGILDIYNRNGDLVADDVEIGSGRVGRVAVSSDAERTFIVWENDTAELGSIDKDIYGRVFSLDGSALTEEFKVNTFTTGNQDFPEIAVLASGLVVTVWASYNQDGSNYGVYGQILDRDGGKVGSEFRINETSEGSQTDPIVLALDSGNFLVVFEGFTDEGVNRVVAKEFDPSGNSISDEIVLGNYENYGDNIEATQLKNGDVIVSWDVWTAGTRDVVAVRIPSGEAQQVIYDITGAVYGTPNNDAIGPDPRLENQLNIIFAREGDDVITLSPDGIWEFGFYAKNVDTEAAIGTGNFYGLYGKLKYQDVIDAGTGIDTLRLSDFDDAFFLDDQFSGFHQLAVDVGASQAPRAVAIDIIEGGAGNDVIDFSSQAFNADISITIRGGDGSDVLWAGEANDVLDGDSGSDWINGGAGDDTLTGGSGADIFEFTATSGNDTITDFAIEDVLKFYRRESDTNDAVVDGAKNQVIWEADGHTVTIDFGTDITESNVTIEYEFI